MVSFENVSKVFTNSLDLTRAYGVRDILGWRRRVPGSLRAGEFFALRDLSFRLATGESLLLLGAAGSGKTTVLQLLGGLLRPDEGRVRVGGRVQLVGESRLGLNPFLTVAESVDLAMALAGVRDERCGEVRDRILTLCELTDRLSTRLADIPKGTHRLLAHLATLYGDADLYLFDGRPVVADDAIRQATLERVTELLQTRTVIVATRTPPTLPVAPTHALVLHDGRAIFCGEPTAVARTYTRFTGIIHRLDRRQHLATRRAAASGDLDLDAMTARDDRVAHAAMHILSPGAFLRNTVMSPLMLAGEIARVRRSGRPVVAGPWLSDTTQEILYWIPFLAWVRLQLPDTQPLVALSRGGADMWYGGAGVAYMDMLDLFGPEDFAARNGERIKASGGGSQDVAASDFERDAIARVAADRWGGEVETLHPSLLNRALAEVWRGRLPSSFIRQYSRYAPLAAPRLPPSARLPPNYVVAGFEHSAPFFEDTEPLRQVIPRMVRAISKRLPVVVLNTGHLIDDGREAAIELGDNVFAPPERPDPRRALDWQTRVLAGANAFVGTFGGLSCLAPFLGVDAFTVYASPAGPFTTHLDVLRAAIPTLGDSAYVVTEAEKVDVARLAAWVAAPASRRRSWFGGRRGRGVRVVA